MAFVRLCALSLLISSLAVASVLACDTTEPVLTDYALTPGAVDVTAGPQAVTCSMTVTDAPAGVAEA